MKLLMVVMLLLFPLSADAAWILYDVNTYQVVGAFEQESDMRPTATQSPLELAGDTVDTIPWPIPSGCLKGQLAWTLVTAPGELPLVLNPALVFFSTTASLWPGCREVESWAQLRGYVEQAMIAKIQEYPLIGALSVLDVVTFIAVCQTASPAACASARSQMAGLNNTPTLFPDPTTLNNFLTQVTTLKNEALALKQAQNW